MLAFDDAPMESWVTSASLFIGLAIVLAWFDVMTVLAIISRRTMNGERATVSLTIASPTLVVLESSDGINPTWRRLAGVSVGSWRRLDPASGSRLLTVSPRRDFPRGGERTGFWVAGVRSNSARS